MTNQEFSLYKRPPPQGVAGTTHHTIGRIAGKPSDYKKCKLCGSINWYEREGCINCPSKEFEEFTEDDAEELLKDYEDNEIELDI